MSTGAACVNYALGNPLVIKMSDLLAQDEVFEQSGAAQPVLERILIVGNEHALIGCQRLCAGVHAHAIQRAGSRVEGLWRIAGAHFRRRGGLGQGAAGDRWVGRDFVLALGRA